MISFRCAGFLEDKAVTYCTFVLLSASTGYEMIVHLQYLANGAKRNSEEE